jgi:protein O-mannosyl-transferase
VTCAVYLGQMVWPRGLAVLYPFPHNGPPAWEAALAGMLLASVSVVAWGERRTRPWLLVGWLWYLAMLLPVLGLIQVGRQAHADRYTYLPQIGIYMAVAWLMSEWRVGRAVFGGLMAGVLAVLMVCAWKQTAYWQNSVTLWTRAIACTTADDMAHNNLGNAFYRKGRVDEAIIQYQQGLEIRPIDAETHRVLGSLLLQKGRTDEAIAQYQAALQIKPDNAEIHNNLGTVLRQTGRVDEAIGEFQKALQIMPDSASVRFNLAKALLQKGRVAEAITQYQMELQLEPADMEVQNNLAWLLATSGQASLRNGEKAVQLARQANELAGGKNPVILGTLAAAFAEAGKFGDAVQSAQKAIALAQAAVRQDLAAQLNDELKHYEAGRPFHHP